VYNSLHTKNDQKNISSPFTFIEIHKPSVPHLAAHSLNSRVRFKLIRRYFTDSAKLAIKMHLMYTLDESGKRIYTLKVSNILCNFCYWTPQYPESERGRWQANHFCPSW